MGSCKYYTEVTLGWMLNNKIIVLLSLLSFCLFVSTLALSGQKNKLYWELYECNNKTVPTPTPTPAPATEATTPAAEASTKKEGETHNEIVNQLNSEDSSGRLFKFLSGTA
ncbi:hypothetical protein PYW08_002557 [Mythimna loreyi]|uniref:Uncharacterized protein n=1 Tax=Mythimna loreyi TaxID=667449 RepID=A0ACC2QKS3_9NEOP|nr:hypothetical protein PYW08_002557 [Mythimna loreyi]